MMLKRKAYLILVAALVWTSAGRLVGDENRLIAVLKSGASQEEKATACRQLARIATKESVPALASLLGDDKLSHMARYALEAVPDPSVDAALRDAMGRLKGKSLVGVIGSLGVRRDAKAVDAMIKLLGDSDGEVAQAAARALGKIGTPEAAKAIEEGLVGATGFKQFDFCDGLFRCAEALAAEGRNAQAQEIYDWLRGLPQAPQQIRAGALRGAIVVRQKDGIPLMLDAIRGEDYVLTAVAVRAAIELRGREITAALAEELPKLPAAKQILIANTLGHRGDASAGPALLALADKGPNTVRLAAIQNVTRLGCAAAVPLLVRLSKGNEAELATAARDCLSAFPGREADAAILAMLAQKDAKVRCLAVEMIGQRGMIQSGATLVRAIGDEDESVRIAALRVLRDRAGLAELPVLLGIFVKGGSSRELQAAESALGALCARRIGSAQGRVVILKATYGNLPEGPSADVTEKVKDLVKAGALAVEASNDVFGDPASGIVKKLRVDYSVDGVVVSKTIAEGEKLTFTAVSAPSEIVDAVCGAMGGARGEAKLALVRALRSARGPKALQAVKEAAADEDARVKDAALRALCEWPTSDAAPSLGELIKAPPSETIKILALRGFVRLVLLQDAPNAKKVELLKKAMGQASRSEEKRLVLSAVGTIPSVESLAFATSHLDDAALKEEACLSAISIAERIVSSHGAEVSAAMQRVGKATSDKKLGARAQAIASQAKK